jgi:hypothetical protein
MKPSKRRNTDPSNQTFGTRRKNVVMLAFLLSLVTYSLISSIYYSTLVYASQPHNQIYERIMAVVTRQHGRQGFTTPSQKIVLLRAIGNALPPRHKPEQALTNLQFVLQNEPNYPGLDKHYVLNRLTDPSIEERLIGMLDAYQQNYTRIPFSFKEYEAIPYDFTLWYQPDIIHRKEFRNKKNTTKTIIEESISNSKGLYVTNQNEARNTMLEIGIQEYPDTAWIMPWDGNCFLHPNAFEELATKLNTLEAETKYFAIPFSRAQTNDELLDPAYHPM